MPPHTCVQSSEDATIPSVPVACCDPPGCAAGTLGAGPLPTSTSSASLAPCSSAVCALPASRASTTSGTTTWVGGLYNQNTALVVAHCTNSGTTTRVSGGVGMSSIESQGHCNMGGWPLQPEYCTSCGPLLGGWVVEFCDRKGHPSSSFLLIFFPPLLSTHCPIGVWRVTTGHTGMVHHHFANALCWLHERVILCRCMRRRAWKDVLLGATVPACKAVRRGAKPSRALP